jgi:hypothetical protein|nr:MAG TPA: hypothetical protein [Caudoviricetes sp.]
MKLSEVFKKLDREAFNINYNFNSQYWELVIFTQDYDIKAEYKGKFLADVLKEHFKEKIDLKVSLEAYYQDGYRNLSLNYDNTDYSDNFITLSLNDRYEDQHERTFILKDINDLVNKLENLNSLFTDYEVELTEVFKEARVYGLYR